MIGLGVLLIVLIGLLSEILKDINNRKDIRYDTTFVYDLLQQSQFLESTQSVEYLLHGMNASSEIIFNKASLIYESSVPRPFDLIKNISEKDNLLYFIRVSDAADYHNFGMFLQKQMPEVDLENDKVNVSESRSMQSYI